MKKRILMSLMALFCLLTVSAQGKYPNGAWQSGPDSKYTGEGVIYTKKAKGRAERYHEIACNGELTLTAENGWEEYYMLTYTGTKNANGHVFNVLMVDTDMLEIQGKVAIKQVGDESKTQPYIIIKAVSPNMKKRMVNNQKLWMIPTNGAGIP